MIKGEFSLIERYFNRKDNSKTVALGIGDDCAILDIPSGYQMAVTTDTLVADVHFFKDVSPYNLGVKSLAVNLSDLAAMGAIPKWVSLAITLPNDDEIWLSEFSRGFFDLANQYNISLIGGDTTKGPLSITVCAKGLVEQGLAIKRNGAKIGDLICVTGNLGDAALGLKYKLVDLQISDKDKFITALELPEPRVDVGLKLKNLASSCIDISDGLAQDLCHILNASNCSAIIDLEKLPLSSHMKKQIDQNFISEHEASQLALTGGDEYELLFTISCENFEHLSNLANDVLITPIGEIVEARDIKIELINTDLKTYSFSGWDHFSPVENNNL